MIKKICSTLIAILLLPSSEAFELTSVNVMESKETSAIACRAAFPDVERNPGEIGGWYLDGDAGRLCLYGTLEEVDQMELQFAISDYSREISRVVVRSSGGPVDPWLAMAEAFGSQTPEVLIDEACFSSCAVYAAPIASRIDFVSKGLLVWHGGPIPSVLEQMFGGHDKHYALLAERTRRLYSSRGISTLLLSETLLPPSEEQMNLVARILPNASKVDGYALSPKSLSTCYGLKAAKDIWHPGGDQRVLEVSNGFSRSLVVLARSQNADGCHEN